LSKASTAGLTYADSGVDIHEKDSFTESLSTVMKRTFGPRVIPNPGGFAGLFRLELAQPRPGAEIDLDAGIAGLLGTLGRRHEARDPHDALGRPLGLVAGEPVREIGAELLEAHGLGNFGEEVILLVQAGAGDRHEHEGEHGSLRERGWRRGAGRRGAAAR
jgi:hypothetical protein